MKFDNLYAIHIKTEPNCRVVRAMNDTLKRNHPPRELVDEHGTSPNRLENVCVSFKVAPLLKHMQVLIFLI